MRVNPDYNSPPEVEEKLAVSAATKRQNIVQDYLESNKSISGIAKKYKVSPAYIRKILNEEVSAGAKALEENRALLVTAMVAKLEEIDQQANRGYKQSLKPLKMLEKKQGDSVKLGTWEETVEKDYEQNGNAAYLNVRLTATRMLATLLGVDRPPESAGDGPRVVILERPAGNREYKSAIPEEEELSG